MKLHDPATEKELIRIARGLAGPAGFQHPGFGFWKNPIQRALACLARLWVAAILFGLIFNAAPPAVLRHTICVLLMMFLVRLGLGQIAMAFTVTGFFGTLANLPITGRKALTHVRGIIHRRLWLPALLGPFVIAIYLHLPLDPGKFTQTLGSWWLFTAIVWATLGITQVSWVRRLHIVKIWHWIAYCLIACLIVMHLFGGGLVLPSASRATMENLLDRIVWVFPPAWVLPGNLAHGGIFPASLWIAWGLWSWLRWPSTAFPNYDRPMDFAGAFGDVGTAVQAEVPPPTEEGIILPDPPPRPPSNGWVDRLIAASIPAADLAAAGALMPAANHTRTMNLTLIFAVFWLLVMGFGKTPLPGEPYHDLFLLVSWVVPSIVFIIGLLSILNPLKDAMRACPVGNTPVPFFTTLPISLRSLLRLTFRITIVRTAIAVAIATPFFWILAKIHQLPEVSPGIVAMIPAIGAAWILSVPAALSNRLDPHLRRRKGIFPLILATSLAQVPIGFLWIVTSVAGIGLSFTWGLGATDGQYAFFLLPGAIACLVFSGAMSRLLFEILHLSLRQRRYDWKSKIR